MLNVISNDQAQSATEEVFLFSYFPRKALARAAADEFELLCSEIELFRAASPLRWLFTRNRWLLILRVEATSDQALKELGDQIEAITVKHRGEYDGWEREQPGACDAHGSCCCG